jgi:diketogulonate reductase-like aldo/keto reductase
MLGFGVYQLSEGKETTDAVSWALEAGYRHIDTAKLYRNEKSVGKAIRDSGLKREEVFVTTKLWPTDQFLPMRAFETSLKKLNLEYIDLYLVHFPVPALVKRTWKQMEEIYATGKCRAIGVSNHSIQQMEDIMSASSAPIAVNQVKCSPFNFDKKLYNFCQKHDIAFEAYSPLTRGEFLGNPTVETIADHYQKSSAQVLIRWALQKNMVVIPKSAHKERIFENADVFDFEISKHEMNILDGLSE